MAHTLYFTLGSGNSFKPALCLKQTGQTCSMRAIDVLGGESRGAAFRRINPRGLVPYLVLEDGRGIGESNAIVWFLATGTKLMPTTPEASAQTIQWMLFEQTSLEPSISPARFYSFILPDQRASHEAKIAEWIEAGNKALQILDTHLSGREFLTDHGYGIADIAVYGYTHLASQGGFELDSFPAVSKWIERVKTTPNYADIDTLLAA
jgi:glutathione S-transferase